LTLNFKGNYVKNPSQTKFLILNHWWFPIIKGSYVQIEYSML
jgi:hypothetical protein